ncbi:MAG: replication protein RepA [Candidatus Dormibacteria bacterium]
MTEFVRRKGQLELTILAPSKTGIPYGSIPRLLLAWVTTEAVRSKEPRLVLGTSMVKFMARLDLCRTGGPRGDSTRLRTQARALFAATISATFDGDGGWTDDGFRVAAHTHLWWDPRNPDQDTLWESSVTLSHEFITEITSRPVPVDMDALRLIKDSPVAIDTYIWMAHRMSYLKRDTLIPWQLLELQLGAGYAHPRDFRRKFSLRLKEVRPVYPAASWDLTTNGLELPPTTESMGAPTSSWRAI